MPPKRLVEGAEGEEADMEEKREECVVEGGLEERGETAREDVKEAERRKTV
jgi:hypothetical protein